MTLATATVREGSDQAPVEGCWKASKTKWQGFNLPLT